MKRIFWFECKMPPPVRRTYISWRDVTFELSVEFKQLYDKRRKRSFGYDIEQSKHVMRLAGVEIASWPSSIRDDTCRPFWWRYDLDDPRSFIRRSLSVNLLTERDLELLSNLLTEMDEELKVWNKTRWNV